MTETKNTRNWRRIALYGLLGVVLLAGIGLVALWQFAPVAIAFAQGSGTIADVNLPDGFEIEVYAEVPNARSMVLSEDGTLFIGSRQAGNVYAIPNAGNPEPELMTIASGLRSPNGVAVVDGDLYVAEIGRLLRYDDVEANLSALPEPVVVTEELPEENHHGWRYMAYGPDGKMYIAVGAPCNVCEIEDYFGTVSRMNLDGSEFEVYATGVRNSVGFDWHPESDVLWFTNNGRDWMGNDSPPDTLHRAPEPGLHFGFPFCHAGDTPDPDFGSRAPCSDFEQPAAQLTPHGASLGMRFYTGEMFPEDYAGQIFIAERGSWNRNPPIGYRVMLA
ncbi:MAG: PQQ-dependent sugar dehydrogenase, partial [Chloroflexota bacterium]